MTQSFKRTPLKYSPSSEDFEQFELIFNQLNSKFPSAYADDLDFNFREFSLFNEYDSFEIGPSIDISSGEKNTFISFIKLSFNDYTSSYKVDKSSYKMHNEIIEFHAWGTTTLRQCFGHVLIRPETIRDKILDALFPVEIDFENDREFSRNYYVIAENNDIAKSTISTEFRSAIMECKEDDLYIEILQNRIIVGNKKIINPESALNLAILLNSLTEV